MAEQYWEQRDCTATWVVSATTLLIGGHRGRLECAHSTSTNKTPAFPPLCIPSHGHSDSVGGSECPEPPKGLHCPLKPDPSSENPLKALPGPSSSAPSTQSSVCLYSELTGSKQEIFSAELQNLGPGWWMHKSCLWCPSNKHGPSRRELGLALTSHFAVTMQVLFHIPILCVERAWPL